jgi:hypothetical protein
VPSTRRMLSAKRFLGSAALLVSLASLAFAPSMPSGAQSSALEVTSDTPEYCLRLLDRLSDLVHASPTPPPAAVTNLSTDGQRMCDQGQTRAGIVRLRRAWMLMTNPDSGAARQ